jgi:hypothetical protein
MKPIDFMTKEPAYCDHPFQVGAFVSFVQFALGKPEFREAFTKETGVTLDSVALANPIEQLIDKATGRTKEVLGAFLDWVVIRLWGESKVKEKSDHKVLPQGSFTITLPKLQELLSDNAVFINLGGESWSRAKVERLIEIAADVEGYIEGHSFFSIDDDEPPTSLVVVHHRLPAPIIDREGSIKQSGWYVYFDEEAEEGYLDFIPDSWTDPATSQLALGI